MRGATAGLASCCEMKATAEPRLLAEDAGTRHRLRQGTWQHRCGRQHEDAAERPVKACSVECVVSHVVPTVGALRSYTCQNTSLHACLCTCAHKFVFFKRICRYLFLDNAFTQINTGFCTLLRLGIRIAASTSLHTFAAVYRGCVTKMLDR